MQPIQDILKEKSGFPVDIAEIHEKEGIKAMGDYCTQKLINQGKVYNEVYGWEYPEVLESFGLNPNMKGVPAVLDYTYEAADSGKEAERDEWGNKTGYYKKKLIKSREKDWVIAPEWLEYKKYKKDEREKWEKEKYARKINTPPMDYYN